MKLERKNQIICNNIVIIDGFSRSGKSMVARMLGYLDRCEQWQTEILYEFIAQMDGLNKISRDASETIINMWADTHIYNLMIGRNVNSRKTDLSSPYFDGLERKFIERLLKPDGDVVLDEIKSINPILPLHVHNILGFSDLLIKGFGTKLKLYILNLRNPFELIELYIDWTKRLCIDPRSFKFCIKNDKNEYFPYYIPETHQGMYKKASNIEKSIITVYCFHKEMFKMADSLDDCFKDKLMFIPFEDFIVNPDKYIDDICIKLETKRVQDFSKMMKSENLPRDYDMNKYYTLEDFLKKYKNKNISKKYLDMLTELKAMYKNFIK